MEPDEAEDWATDAAGTPEGDGDFESDGLPETGETSAGGQPKPAVDREDGTDGKHHPHEPGGLKHLIDEIITGKIQP